MSDNITIIGNIAVDPKFFTTPSGVSITTFRVASSQRRYDRSQEKWVDGETNWYSVSAFRSLADHAFASLRKGDRIVVTGRLRLRQWDVGGRQSITAEIDAEALGPDLLWGTTVFRRAAGTRSTPETGAEHATDQASGGDQWAVPTPDADASPSAVDATDDVAMEAVAMALLDADPARTEEGEPTWANAGTPF